MPYLTIPSTPRSKQVSFDDIIGGEVPMDRFGVVHYKGSTLTRYFEVVPEKFRLSEEREQGMVDALAEFNRRYEKLFECNRPELYTTFFIPKKSGGLRRIDAPKPELMDALSELKGIFENKFRALYHSSAFAYVKKRCIVDAIERHQANGSNWFAKTDFENFFGNTTFDFIISTLKEIFPFSEIMKRKDGEEAVKKAIDLCMLNGGLPQGTPISPMLTNLVMIPIDFDISNALHKEGFVYTRYADDTQISHKKSFSVDEICGLIEDILRRHNAPFKLKGSKTRYGSKAGSNWNLGLMLNANNDITVGHRNMKRFKAMCHSYIMSATKDRNPWPLEDVQTFYGLLSYYRSIEKDTVNHIIQWYNKKYSVDLEAMIKESIRHPV